MPSGHVPTAFLMCPLFSLPYRAGGMVTGDSLIQFIKLLCVAVAIQMDETRNRNISQVAMVMALFDNGLPAAF